jgi:hypothetical protein
VRLVILSPTMLLLAGCFYTDQINQRPGIEIVQNPDDLVVYRDSMVTLEAESNDPENHIVFFQWRAYACTPSPDCDAEPFDTNVTNDATPGTSRKEWTFRVPKTLADMTTPVQVVRVVLEAQDDFGAIARPQQELLIPILNHAPELKVTSNARYQEIVDTPIELSARVGDADDGPASVEVTWKVYSPMNQPPFTLVDFDIPDDDPEHYFQLGKRFTPKGDGLWKVEVTATDPLGGSSTETLEINVRPDGPPCLSQWAPITAPTGSALPLTEPTLFRINVVSDVLDPFPTIPGDAQLGTTKFAWSIKQPGSGTRDPLSVTSNQASLDPVNYQPGDIVELRVEIQDRNNTTITCADNLATCSVISDNNCIQRLTWRVEVH